MKRLGDELFRKEAKQLGKLDKKAAKQIIESDSPELIGLLQEFRDSLDQANNKLQPVIEKIKSKQIESTAAGMSYLEMKYNLLMSYCTFLSFYLLMKLEGKSVEGHPVIYKLAHIKTLFEKLKPLDQKLQYQIEKMIKLAQEQNAQKTSLSYRPNIEDLQESEGSSDQSEEEEGLDDSEVEEDMGKVSASEDSEESGKKANVYKAPKLNAIQYEDPKDKKARQRETYEKKKLGKSNLM